MAARDDRAAAGARCSSAAARVSRAESWRRFPGRAIGTVRIVIACVVVLVLCMALRVPEAHLAVWVVLRLAMEEASETLLFGVVALIALTIGLAISLVLLTIAMDQPWLRFCLMAAMAALGLFLRRTFVIGALGFVIGLVGTLS